MVEQGNLDFGVRDVVERAQVSLRTFYQYFDTRDDFTLTIFTAVMRIEARAIADTLPVRGRLARFRHIINCMVIPSQWVTLFSQFTPEEAMTRSRALAREGFRLRDAKPEGFRAAIAPLESLIAEVTGASAEDATIVLNSLMASSYDLTVTPDVDADAVADRLFRYHRKALGI